MKSPEIGFPSVDTTGLSTPSCVSGMFGWNCPPTSFPLTPRTPARNGLPMSDWRTCGCCTSNCRCVMTSGMVPHRLTGRRKSERSPSTWPSTFLTSSQAILDPELVRPLSLRHARIRPADHAGLRRRLLAPHRAHERHQLEAGILHQPTRDASSLLEPGLRCRRARLIHRQQALVGVIRHQVGEIAAAPATLRDIPSNRWDGLRRAGGTSPKRSEAGAERAACAAGGTPQRAAGSAESGANG